MRHVMGVAVLSGMFGVTFFGLIFTPLFYVLIRSIAAGWKKPVAIPEDIHPLRPTAWRPTLAVGNDGSNHA
jgi:multidrug efflux pump